MIEKSEKISKTIAASVTGVITIVVVLAFFFREVAWAVFGFFMLAFVFLIIYGVYKIIEACIEGPIYLRISQKQFAKEQEERDRKIREYEAANPDKFEK